MKTEYIVYNNGRSPKDKIGGERRKELASVSFVRVIQDKGMSGNVKTKLMTVMLPNGHSYYTQRGTNYLDNTLKWKNSKAEASAKNFRLMDADNRLVLEFVKVAEDHYGLEFNWPFTPLQAFGVALTSIDK